MPWVIEYDIVGLFDNINHDLMMKAVQWHTEEKWVILYVNRIPLTRKGDSRWAKVRAVTSNVLHRIIAMNSSVYPWTRWFDTVLTPGLIIKLHFIVILKSRLGL